MRVAYLIMVHKNPKLLKRAIAVLTSPNSGFFVHVDSKRNVNDFSDIDGENVFFSKKRLPVYWGEFSQVQAILLLMRQALESVRSYDYFILLSGSDYPLRSSRYIHTFLEKNRGCDFMDLIKMPAPGKPISRINTLRYQSDKPVRRFAVRALAKLGLAQRDHGKYLGSLEPYAGGTWALTRDACRYLLDFIERNPHVTEYFQDTFAPDESFFHTILGNSHFASRIRRGLYYTEWTGGAHPLIIGDRHIALFEAQERIILTDMYGTGEVLFARKFSDENLDLLQRVDKLIARYG
jgi:hypothetical protein